MDSHRGQSLEFDFRYSNRAANGIDDTERSVEAMRRIVGERLTYSSTRRARAAA